MANYQSYIICTSPRSGSTLLCKMLSATALAGNPDSHFHKPSLAEWLDSYHLSRGSYSNEVEAIRAVFEAALERGSGSSSVFGLRMQQHSFDFFLRQLQLLYPAQASDRNRIQQAFGTTLYIRLLRSSKLDQAISLVKATQTGLWHKAPDGTELERLSEPQEPDYDAAAIAQSLSELTEMDSRWQSWFAQQCLHPYFIDYDNLANDPTGVLADLLDHLGLDAQTAYQISLPVAKLADSVSKDWAQKFLAEQ